MSAIENPSLSTTNMSSKRSVSNSPTSSNDQSLRNNSTIPYSKQQQHEEFAQPHVLQSYSSTTSLEKHEAMSTNNANAFHMSPIMYSNPSHPQHQQQHYMNETITTSTNTTNTSTTESSASQGELARSNQRNSPPTSTGASFHRVQPFSQQENEAILYTTKTSNNNHHHNHHLYPGSNMVMSSVGNGSSTTTTSNNHMATSVGHQQLQDQDKLGQSYHHSMISNATSSPPHVMNGGGSSLSSHQHSHTSSMHGISTSVVYDNNNMSQRSSVAQPQSSTHDKNLLPSLHILMDSPASTSPSNPIPHTSNSRIYGQPPPNNNHSNGSMHMRQSSSNNLQQSNYMNHHQPSPIPYSQQHVSNDYPPTNNNHVPPPTYINKASHHIDMFSNPPPNNNLVKSSNSNMDATNMYAPRPIRSRSNTSGPNNASFSSPPSHSASSSLHHQNDSTVYSFEQPAKIKKKKALPSSNDDSNDADKKNWKKKRLFSIDEVTDLVAFVKQRSENQELTRDVNYAIFKEYEKLQDERRRASVYRKKYVQLFERHLISKDGTIDPSLFQEYDQRTSSSKTKGSHSEDAQEKRKFSDVEEDSSSEGSNIEEEKKTSKKVKREYSDEEEEENENASPSEDKKKNMNICVSFKGKNYLHSIEKNILQNSESIHNYFNNLAISSLCCNSESELIRSESIEYFDYSFGEFIQINSFSITRVLKSIPVKLRIN